jgi:hypothetical protein
MNALLCEQPFIASVAEPEGRSASIGVIVIGMGMADVRVAKRLAKLGFLAVQMRLIKDTVHHRDVQRRFATYDTSGVARCRQAMDTLSASHGVTQFIFMGNCALANISFNTALVDPRVVGLILTNPYVSKRLTSGLMFKLRWHLLRRRSWLRLLRGKMNLQPAVQALIGDRNPPELEDTAPPDLKQDIALPPDFDRRLDGLMQGRRMPVLLVFSENEASLEYFRRFYRGTLRSLVARGSLRFEVIDTQVHDFSARDDSALRLNNIVADWVGKTWA